MGDPISLASVPTAGYRRWRRRSAIQDLFPHVVLHEFETWVIAAALETTQVLGEAVVAKKLQQEARSVDDDVELLNDSLATAPSKRVIRCWPDYAKVTDGVEVIREAGLDIVMDRCPGLRAWVGELLAR